MTVRLAILATHPIQYLSPSYGELAKQQGIELRVFYGWRGATELARDPGFGRSFQWDIPLLDGYEYEFVENVSRQPGSHHFRGIDLPGLRTRLDAWKPDALLVYGWCYKAHLSAMRHYKGRIPVLFRGDSTMLTPLPLWRTWCRNKLLSWIYKHIDLAFYVGTNNRNYYLAHGVSESKLVFAPHAIDNRRFQSLPNLAEATQLRHSLGIGESEVVFLLPAKLEHVKAPHLLLDAFERVQRQATGNAHLIFAGSGPLEASLRSRGVPHTHFIGFQNQSRMPIVYRAADLVVLPSFHETWGLVINEAMACGRPVLASDRVGSAVDLIVPGHNGWIIAASDVHALANALDQAIQIGRKTLHDLGENSMEIISKWNIPFQAKQIANTASRLVDER